MDVDRETSAQTVRKRYLRASSIERVAAKPASFGIMSRRAIIANSCFIGLFTTFGLLLQFIETADATPLQSVVINEPAPVCNLPTVSTMWTDQLSNSEISADKTPTSALVGVQPAQKKYLVVLFSSTTSAPAIDLAQRLKNGNLNPSVIQTNTGLFAIALGQFSRAEATRVQQKVRSDGLASDAYLVHQRRVTRWLNSSRKTFEPIDEAPELVRLALQ